MGELFVNKKHLISKPTGNLLRLFAQKGTKRHFRFKSEPEENSTPNVLVKEPNNEDQIALGYQREDMHE